MRNFYLLSLLFALSLSTITKAQNFAWAKKMGANNSDEGRAIAIDALGNVYTTGYFDGTVDFDPGAGVSNLISNGTDAYISKLDASGNFVWAKKLSGNGGEFGVSIAIDGSGNVLTTGTFDGSNVDFDPGAGTFTLGSSAASVDIYISKLDASGNFIWAKSIGSFNADIPTSLATDASGNVYTTGYFKGAVDFDPGAGTFSLTETGGGGDIFISKLDASGNFVWAKRIGSGSFSTDYGYGISVDASGNVLTTGVFFGTCDFDPGAGTFNLSLPGGGNNIFVSKLDGSGNFVWAQALGGGGLCEGKAITTDPAGNVYTTGYFTGISDFDPSASTYTIASAGSEDIFVSKLDASGNFLWAKGMGGSNIEQATSIKVGPSGNVYTTGYFRGTADFNPDVATYTLASTGSFGDDVFISSLDASGNFSWAVRIGGTSSSSDVGKGITTDAAENVHVTGVFFSTVDFDPGTGTFNLTAGGTSGDAFVLKLANPASSVSEINTASTIVVYPNPNTGAFTIKTNTNSSYDVTVYNSIGQMVKQSVDIRGDKQIDLSGFAKGIYSVVLNATDNYTTIKVIVE